MAKIGMLNEGALHAALKQDYLGDNGAAEVPFSGFVADVVRDGVIYEIQTSSFSGLGRKMRDLAELGPVVLVHPIAQRKTLVRLQDAQTGEITTRRSPKRGAMVHILRELVYLPDMLGHPNFAVEVVLTEEEEQQEFDPKGRRGRGGWRRKGRHLIRVLERLRINAPEDLWGFVGQELPGVFTTRDLAQAMGQTAELGRQLAYCLRHLGVIEVCGKTGNAINYRCTG